MVQIGPFPYSPGLATVYILASRGGNYVNGSSGALIPLTGGNRQYAVIYLSDSGHPGQYYGMLPIATPKGRYEIEIFQRASGSPVNTDSNIGVGGYSVDCRTRSVDLTALSRWTFASISQFISDNKGTYNVWFQGDDTPPTTWQSWAEVYMGGPRWKQPSRATILVDMEVMIALVVKPSLTDAHLPYRLRDQFANALNIGLIHCFRFGSDPIKDDGSLIGCYLHRNDVKHPVDGFDYATVDATTKLTRATVEGFYRMEISLP